MTTTTSKNATPKNGVDPRGPRFGAGITAVLLLAIVFLWLIGQTVFATVLQYWVVVVFAWGAFAGIQSHPYGKLFAKFVRPRLAPPAELEDPRPLNFAQLVGFIITAAGVVLALVFNLWTAIPVSAAIAFVAAFLNSVFGYCLGCQMWLLLVRAKVIKAA